MMKVWQMTDKADVRMLNGKWRKDTFLRWGIYFYAMSGFVILKAVPYVNDDVFICISTIMLTYFLGRDFYKALNVFLETSKGHKVRNWLFLLACSLIISFSVNANDWFYHVYWGCWEPSIWGVTCFLFMTGYVMLLCISVNFWVVYRPGRESQGAEAGKGFRCLIYGNFWC